MTKSAPPKFKFNRFLVDRDGNFGIMTALIMVPLLCAAGSALDLSSAHNEQRNMQNIADSAALAGGAIYDGTNTDAVIARAESVLKGAQANLLSNMTYNVSMTGQRVNVTIDAQRTNDFMQIVGIKNLNIGVASETVAPMMPKTINFKPTKAQGWYYKKVTIRVVRPKATVEEVVGTVTYQPTTQSDGGQGTMTVTPTGTFDLGKYTKLVLQMDIKNDGCGTGEKANVVNSKVTCNKSTNLADSKFDLVLRTDNPATSHYLFVEGKQLPKGVNSPLDDILVCGKTSNHAWEDGGGFARQDFFYTVTTTCAPDGTFVRLTK
ncbi:pilus assembly protein [Agrobacterium rosae]|uniref:TadE/TadG family type IV pilus assembly protein n=1 Tax=Agrobacterium rosae TaxID=1972867 RepID=UPI0019D4068E|nr:TadE/TadG family type IV pilus assembly protein [Agrobacterium rosae]MBN7805603.1 pilus assembly protein [Agrobacterium rosae]